MNFAPVIPLRRDVENGFAMITKIKELIKFHLKNLLLTSPGEKISNNSYGVGIKRFLFEPMNSTTNRIIEDSIKSQIKANLSYLSSIQINISSDAEGNFISIELKYDIKNLGESDVLNLTFQNLQIAQQGGYLL